MKEIEKILKKEINSDYIDEAKSIIMISGCQEEFLLNDLLLHTDSDYTLEEK